MLLRYVYQIRYVPTQRMLRTPRAPRLVSLAELITMGYLAENDVQPGGHVDDARRNRAEQQFLVTRPRTAPPVRHVSSPRLPPVVVLPRTVRASSAHAHRVHVRRDVQGVDRTPVRVMLDTCCICYANVKDHAVVPCFHMCVCSTCAMRIQHCPMCRGSIDRIQRIYL